MNNCGDAVEQVIRLSSEAIQAVQFRSYRAREYRILSIVLYVKI